MDCTVGIDLGTTNSCVAIFKNDHVDIIEDDSGSRVVPSWVTFTENVVLVGTEARNMAHEYPKSAIYECKRLIGHSYSNPKVQEDMKRFTYKVVDDFDSPRIHVEVKGQNLKLYYPEEIGAYILEHIKRIVDQRLSTNVRRAVITVPAYFNDTQRQATIDAGKIAGFETINIINEPTAAALAFDHHHKKPYSRNILVYDFGGGTFDVSIVSIGRGKCDVRATDGDTHLGGTDIDTNLMDFVKEEYRQRYKKEIHLDDMTSRRLKNACEKVKRVLSNQHHATMEFGSLAETDYEGKITRAKFEMLNETVFKRTIDIVKACLKSSGLEVADIDEVILVGGSSRIPKVRELLDVYFGEDKINVGSVNPDEAVAQGAAIYALKLAGNKNEVKDVTSLSLGTNTYGDSMSTIIPRNTPIPAKAIKRYQTVMDDQTTMEVPIYQGEDERASNNHELGDFTMVGLTAAPAKTVAVEICFELNYEGILHVSAIEINSANKEKTKIEIDVNKKGLTDEQIRDRTAELKKNKEKYDARRNFEQQKYDLEHLLNRLREYAETREEAEKNTLLDKYDKYYKVMDKVKFEDADKVRETIGEIQVLLGIKSDDSSQKQSGDGSDQKTSDADNSESNNSSNQKENANSSNQKENANSSGQSESKTSSDQSQAKEDSEQEQSTKGNSKQEAQ